jgi:hypothetical protein
MILAIFPIVRRGPKLATILVACAATVVASESIAHSESSTPAEPTAPAPKPAVIGSTSTGIRWYGYQTLALDAASVALIYGGANSGGSSGGTALAALGVMLWVAGGPAVHGLHHQPGRSLASVGLRLGGPLAGALIGVGIGAAVPHPSEGTNTAMLPPTLVGGLVGFLLGAIGGAVVDDLALAYDTHPEGSRLPAAAPQSKSFIAPIVLMAPQPERGTGATVGFVGQF